MDIFPTSNKAWIYSKVPSPEVNNETIHLIDTPMPREKDLEEGDIIIKTTYLSVDPYMRLCMMPSSNLPVPHFELGQPISGGSTGVVIASRNSGFAEGDQVTGMISWQLVNLVKGAEGIGKIDANSISPSAYLGVLGLTGVTAYLGLDLIAKPSSGETIFVSGAAGAVGSVVGQLAKRMGLRVIGSAGSAEKLEYLRSIGFDDVLNYRKDNLHEAMKKVSPDGFDIYWDNVGGDTLQSALDNMKPYGRVVMVGSVSEYNVNDDEKPGVRLNLLDVVFKRLKIEGFVAVDHMDRFEEAVTQLLSLIKRSELVSKETVLEGFEKMDEALFGLFSGKNIGKMVVKAA